MLITILSICYLIAPSLTYSSLEKQSKNLRDWLQEGGAEIDKVQISMKAKENRILIASKPIKKGEIVLFIPLSHILSMTLAKEQSTINQQILESHQDNQLNSTFMVNYLIQENEKNNSFWRPYIDILPKNGNGFIEFLMKGKFKQLKGSLLMNKFSNYRQMEEEQFDKLKEFYKDRQQEDFFKEFYKFKVLAETRQFNIRVNDEKESILVPLADLSNHNPDNNMEFDYDQKKNGFTYTANRDIQENEELTILYRDVSNFELFFSYGFALENYHNNEFQFRTCLYTSNLIMSICLLLDEQLFELKKSITHGKTCHQTKITNTTNDNYLKRLLGIMRFTAISRLDEFLYMETIAEKALYFDPQYNLQLACTINIEKKAWTHLKKILLMESYNFINSIKDDQVLLNLSYITDIDRSIITVTMKEKQLIETYIEICDQILYLLDQSEIEIFNAAQNVQYEKIKNYLVNEIIPLKSFYQYYI